MKSYGINYTNKVISKEEKIIEELTLNGYCIVEEFLDRRECDVLISKLEAVYKQQENEFGSEKLSIINELNVCRMPFLYDDYFLKILSNDWVVKLFEEYVEGKLILHLQNGIINQPKIDHHQASWHRDLPYQDYVVSKPIGLNAFYCLTEFNPNNGSSVLLPMSHKMEVFPSEDYLKKNAIQLNVRKGTLILFDSFVYHKAGVNNSNEIRYGLNHVYVRPFIKQQVNIPACIKDWSLINDSQQDLLGRSSLVADSVKSFRENRIRKKIE
jgi:ectoine hydroxylase-related dioxygenase (phytanoyl-CoA dioxygenase family)|tara:strand:- start:2895 stop:3701 length:807 start_codon:yes stop_codon:yes gene_type:complete